MTRSTSEEIITLEQPKDVQHPHLNIIEIVYNKDMQRVFIEYEFKAMHYENHQMSFKVEEIDDELHITQRAIGMVKAQDVNANPQTTGEKSAYWTYKILEELGFIVDGFNPHEETL
jgi:hypothetical protein